MCPVEVAATEILSPVAALKRTAAAGLRPPPIEASYRGGKVQRQRLTGMDLTPAGRRLLADKVLMRLNFLRPAANG
jgi:hypothetical protein